MTALLVLLLAVASVVDGSAWVRGRTSRSPAKARLLAGVLAVVAFGVLIGWPILHLHGSGIILGILVAVVWLSSALVPQRWWGRLRRLCRAERAGAEDDVDRVMRLARLARAGVLILAVAFCAVASQPLGSGVAKVIAAVGAVILLTVPANRVVSDILAIARRRMNNRATWVRQCAAVAGSARLSGFSLFYSPRSRRQPRLPRS